MPSRLRLTALAVAACLPLSLHADSNWLENGHFTDGITHWHGDAQAPSDFAPASPFDKPDPFFSEGLIVTLKHLDWTKVAQDFTGEADTDAFLTITYKVSGDLAFSKKDDDYGNALPDPAQIGNVAEKGQWAVFVNNQDNGNELFFPVQPRFHTTGVQTFHTKVSGLSGHHANTITLEFPPGQGSVVILSAILAKSGHDDP